MASAAKRARCRRSTAETLSDPEMNSDSETSRAKIGRVRFHVCPKCGSDAVRMRRRLIDRLQSVMVPSRRFRCNSFQCQYEYNVPKSPSSKQRPLLAFAGLLVIVLASVLVMNGGLRSLPGEPNRRPVSTTEPPASAPAQLSN